MSKRIEVEVDGQVKTIVADSLKEVFFPEYNLRLKSILHTYTDYEREIEVKEKRLAEILMQGRINLYSIIG